MTANRSESSQRSDREYVGGLAHGLRVVEAFDERHPEMTLSEIARRAGLSPATARRSLLTLGSLGYVAAANGRYRLNARILALGSAYLRSSGAQDVLEPELRALVAKLGDSAGIGILAGENVLYVAYQCIPRGVRPVAGVGVSFPAHATAMGRVLLAAMPEDERDGWLAGATLEKWTDLTETDPGRLRAVLRRTAGRGYATIRDELYYGVTSLAVPVLDLSGATVAALNSSGYSGLVTERQLVETRLAALQSAAAAISRLVNRHPVLLPSLRIAPTRRAGI